MISGVTYSPELGSKITRVLGATDRVKWSRLHQPLFDNPLTSFRGVSPWTASASPPA